MLKGKDGVSYDVQINSTRIIIDNCIDDKCALLPGLDGTCEGTWHHTQSQSSLNHYSSNLDFKWVDPILSCTPWMQVSNHSSPVPTGTDNAIDNDIPLTFYFSLHFIFHSETHIWKYLWKTFVFKVAITHPHNFICKHSKMIIILKW